MAGFATLRPATWHFSLCSAAGILSRLQTATMVFNLNLALLSMIPPFARHRQETTKALQNPGQHFCSGPSHSGRNLQDRGRLLDHTQTFLLPHLCPNLEPFFGRPHFLLDTAGARITRVLYGDTASHVARRSPQVSLGGFLSSAPSAPRAAFPGWISSSMQLLLSALLGPPYQRNAIPAVWGNTAGGRGTGGTLGNAVARAASFQARRSPGLRLCNL